MNDAALGTEAEEAVDRAAPPADRRVPAPARLTPLNRIFLQPPPAWISRLDFRFWANPLGRLVAVWVAIFLLIAGATLGLILDLHDTALSQAGEELRRTTLLLAEQADRAFAAVDVVQTALLDRLKIDEIATPEEFRQKLSTFAVHEELAVRVSTLAQLDALTIIDTDGNLINFSRFWPIPQVNVADRDYFTALRDDPNRTTYFGVPVQNRGTGTWTLYLARKVTSPNHRFLGVILAAIPTSFFEQLYSRVVTGPDSAISMFRTDGILLARYPAAGLHTGQALALKRAYGQQDKQLSQSTVVRKISEVDGRETMFASRPLLDYPVAVNSMNTISAILAEWRKQVIFLTAAAVILELVAAALGILMLRQLRSQRMLSDSRASNAESNAKLLMAHERERANRETRIQNVRFGAALSNMSQALCLFDSQDRLIVANNRLAEMFGVPVTSIAPGTRLDELLAKLGSAGADSMRLNLRHLVLANRRATGVRELSDGRTLATTFAPVDGEGWLVTLEDISAQQVAKARITHMAHHDSLTGLPNRVQFYDKLIEALARSGRGEQCAVLFLDLDHFKAVNDTLGHPIGDALLRAVTRRLQAELRETDTVARLGGDEFAIVQSDVDQPVASTALAKRLIEVVGMPYELDGHQVTIGTSIGIALVPADGSEPDQILKNADMALYRAKSDGRSRYRFFAPEMDARMQARRTLEIDLRKALDAGEFVLFYQPLMNLKTGSVSGFEALMRWVHPERGLVPPSDFIPLAEEIGLLVPLGLWALRRACFDATTWPARMKVAVNVSVTQFASGTLVDDVADALRDSGLDPTLLELEITETVMLEDTEEMLRVLYRLRDLGVGIALDDFGTGYSSLSYLRRFPFTKVKIDRSFIEGLGSARDSDAIVHAVTDLCESLGMIALAEGVETEDQLKRLRGGNCGEAQGYLFSKPRPANEVAELCKSLTRQQLAETIH